MATRRTWFVWHGWIGLTAGLLLFVICWSGTFSVFSRDIDRLLDPRLSAPASTRVDWQAIYDSARAKFSGWTLLQISGPASPGQAAETLAEDEAGVLRRIYSDPGTGEVIGATSFFSVQRFFRSFHMSLMIGELSIWGIPLGYLVVGLLSLPLLASAVTSLVFYRRFWRGFFRLHVDRGARVFWSDLHKLAGLWSLCFLLLIALTGAWYLAEWKAPGGPSPPEPAPALSAEPLPIATLVHAAQHSYPELQIRTIGLHDLKNGLFEVQGQDGSWLVRDRAAKAWVDSRSGQTIRVQRPRNMDIYQRWIETADPLHFGNFAGLPVKALWFLFGLGLSGLCLSGAYLQAKRQQLRRRTEYRRSILIAYGATAAILILSCIFGAREILSYGSHGQLPAIRPAQLAVIVAWIASTITILGLWMRWVR